MILSETPLFSRLMQSSPYSEYELASLILTAPTRYKDHYIEKRNNRGKRLISQPTAEVKSLQKYIIRNEFNNLEIHNAAFAYIKNKSIVHHASLHAKNHFLMKLDFEEFFPSLNEDTLKHRLKLDTAYSEAEIEILIKLLMRKDRSSNKHILSIGAPSSPFISNYLLIEFDQMMSEFCESNNLVYSRYADDIAISTAIPDVLDHALGHLILLLEKLSYLNLKLNNSKTVNVSKKHHRQLVGLTLSNDGSVSIGRENKRRIRAAVDSYSKGKLNAEASQKLMGQLAFYLSVDKSYVCKLLQKYQCKSIQDLIFKFKLE